MADAIPPPPAGAEPISEPPPPPGAVAINSAPEEQPSAFHRFMSSTWNALPHPVDAIQEWWNRPHENAKALDAIHTMTVVHRRAAAMPENQGKPSNKWVSPEIKPEEQAVIDAGMQAHVGANQDTTGMMGPGIAATQQAVHGDIAGAAGTMVGGYGIPAAVGAAAGAIPEGTGTALKEGAKTAAPDVARGSAKAAAGYGIAHLPMDPFAEAVAGGSMIAKGAADVGAGIVKGYSAFKKSLAATKAAAQSEAGRGVSRTPGWAGLPAPHEEQFGPVGPIEKPTLASGRAPGPAAQPAPAPRTPVWEGQQAAAEAPSAQEGPLARPTIPSGRIPPPPPGAVAIEPAEAIPVSGAAPEPVPASEAPAMAPEPVSAPAQAEPQPTPQQNPQITPVGQAAPYAGDFESAYGIAPEERTQPRMVAPATSYQQAARTVKARALARWLRLGNVPVEDAKLMQAEHWKMAAEGAGVNAPSESTVPMVIQELEKLYKAKGAVKINQAMAEGDHHAANFHLQNIAENGTLPANEAAQPSPGETGAGASGPRASVQKPTAGIPAQPVSNATSVILPGENTELPAEYRLRELEDIQTSHHGVTFQPNPKYSLTNDRDYSVRDNQGKVLEGAGPKFNPRLLVTDNPDATNGPPVINSKGEALGGNGRGMILQRVYSSNPTGVAAYKSLLKQKAAQYGLDPAAIDRMRNPVLVREIPDHAILNAGDTITDLNKSGTQALRPAERAIADSRRVSQHTLDSVAAKMDAIGPNATLNQVLSGKEGAEILGKLMDDGIVTPQERAGLAEGDTLTAAGKQRISQLLLGRFFHDPAQLGRIPANVIGKLERIAAPLARVEGSEDWTLTPRIQGALNLIENAAVHGTKNIGDFTRQAGLLSTEVYPPEVIDMAKKLQRMPAVRLRQAVTQYAQDARFASGGASLFGETPVPADSFAKAFGKAAAE